MNPKATAHHTRGDFNIDIYDNIKPDEVHIAIFKPDKNGIPIGAVKWASVKKIFFQFRAEGFLDYYPHRKVLISFPNKRLPDGSIQFQAINVSADTTPMAGTCGDDGSEWWQKDDSTGYKEGSDEESPSSH